MTKENEDSNVKMLWPLLSTEFLYLFWLSRNEEIYDASSLLCGHSGCFWVEVSRNVVRQA